MQNNSRASTLAPSFASLSTKKLDLEVTVDPLFKKTCADFDEGGATGLLMNHLGIDGTGKLVFDAGDAGVDDGDEDEDEEDDEEDEERKRREAKNKHVDVTGLKGKSASPQPRSGVRRHACKSQRMLPISLAGG